MRDVNNLRYFAEVVDRGSYAAGEGIDVALRVRPRLDEQAQLVTRTLGILRTQLMASPGQLARPGPVTRFDLETLWQAVLWGSGMGALPEYLCREVLAAGRRQRKLAGWTSKPVIVHAAFPTRLGMLPAARAFLDHVYEYVSAGVQRFRGAVQWS